WHPEQATASRSSRPRIRDCGNAARLDMGNALAHHHGRTPRRYFWEKGCSNGGRNRFGIVRPGLEQANQNRQLAKERGDARFWFTSDASCLKCEFALGRRSHSVMTWLHPSTGRNTGRGLVCAGKPANFLVHSFPKTSN